MNKLISAGFAISFIAAATSCAEQEIANAPPALVEECQREIAVLTEPEPALAQRETVRGTGPESAERVIEDARAAREEANREGLAGWPDEVLIYRCLASRGVSLTVEQAEQVAKWERRLKQEQ